MKFFLISTMILIIYVIMDIIYDDYLWDESTKFTIYIQNHTFVSEQLIFKAFSIVVILTPIFLGSLHLLIGKQKIEAILYLTVCVIGIVTNSLLKNIYHQARPYWIENDIQGIGCNSEFGKPSGHAQTSVIIYLSYVLIFYRKKQEQQLNTQVNDIENNQELTNEKETNTIFNILIIFAIISMFITGLSRVYLGVHTIGQVALGWCYGLYIVLNYQIYAHNFLYDYFNFQLSKESPLEVRFQRLSVSSSMIFVFLILIDSLLLELNKHLFNKDEQEINDWLNKIDECKGQEIGYYTTKNINVLYNNCFLQGTLFSFTFAIIQGCFFTQGTYDQQQYQISMKDKSIQFKLFRLFWLFPMIIPVPLLLLQTNNAYLSGLLIYIPIVIFEGLYFTVIYPKILCKRKLQVEGDFLEYKKGLYEQLSQS